IDFMWLFLAQTEFQLGFERTIFKFTKQRLAISTNASFRGIMAQFNLTVIFRDREFNSLIDEVLAFHKAFVEIPNEPAKPTDLGPILLIEESLVCAFVNLAASDM